MENKVGKLIALALGGMMILGIGGFCALTLSNNQTIVEEIGSVSEEKRRFDDLGMAIDLPTQWKSVERNIDMYGELPKENIEGQLVISFILDETMKKAEELNKEANKISEAETQKIEEMAAQIMSLTKEFKELCIIASINKDKPYSTSQKELFGKYENQELIGTQDNLDFYLLYNNAPDLESVSETSKKIYEQVHSQVKQLKDSIEIFKPMTEQDKLKENKQVQFESVTLNEEAINSEIFKDSQLTMVNIWATYCTPCIGEMPDLQKLYEEVKGEGINIMGIVSDATDEETKLLAKEIVSKKGVQFTNILPSEALTESLLQDVSGVPTTFFVDNQGNVIGDFLVGAYSKEEYQNAIQNRLEQLSRD